MSRGFTLVEMLVAVAIFAIVMTMSVSALMDMVSATRKAQAIQSVMNNLNVALDGMVRNVRMGTRYHCGNPGDSASSLATVADCTSSGKELIGFEAYGGDTATPSDQWAYWVENNRLYKTEDGGATLLPITAPEIQIDVFKVFVTGSTPLSGGNLLQPKVVFLIQGTAAAEGNTSSVIGTEDKTRTTFKIQAVATQRVLDL